MTRRITGQYEYGRVWVDGRELLPHYSLTVANHSPTGFNWGYLGSGPTQLALALCLLFFPEKYALRYYQRFKFDFVAKWPQRDFDIEIDPDRICALWDMESGEYTYEE